MKGGKLGLREGVDVGTGVEGFDDVFGEGELAGPVVGMVGRDDGGIVGFREGLAVIGARDGATVVGRWVGKGAE